MEDSMRFRQALSLAVTVALALGATGLLAQQTASHSKIYTLGSGSPLLRSIRELIAHSDRIVIAEVADIREVSVDLEFPSLPRERVTFRACMKCNIPRDHGPGVRDLKRNENLVNAPKTVDMTLVPGSTARLNVNDRVLWFLSAEDSDKVRRTVGSGLFVIHDDDSVIKLNAENDYENTKLWSPEESLFGLYPEARVELNLRVHYEKLYSSETKSVTDARVKTVMASGKQPSPRGALPLDLLTAVVVTAQTSTR
jgi:hypothetical protein